MQDLPRALVGEWIFLSTLVGGHELERSAGQSRIEGQVLDRGDDAVTAEWGDVPGNPRISDPPVRSCRGEHL